MDFVKVFVLVLMIIFLLIVGPFLTIWGLNTLFPVLNIPYSIETWAAIILLKGFATAKVTINK